LDEVVDEKISIHLKKSNLARDIFYFYINVFVAKLYSDVF